jgi:tetratricopeptide (TPR) repeat protein
LEMLSRLINKSMVTVTRTSLGVRYHLLETLREYALEKAEEGADQHPIRHQHAAFFLAFAEQLESEFESGRSTALVEDRAEQEHQNLLAALAWCNSAPDGSQSALRIASALRPFWEVRGYLQLAKQLLTHTLGQDDPPTRTIVRLKALDAAGYFLEWCGELDAARRTYEESLQLADDLGEQGDVTNALLSLAGIAWEERHSQAEMLQRHSREVSRRHVAISRRHVARIQFMGRWH